MAFVLVFHYMLLILVQVRRLIGNQLSIIANNYEWELLLEQLIAILPCLAKECWGGVAGAIQLSIHTIMFSCRQLGKEYF